MVFCERNKIHMISDEVYALSVYDTVYKDAPKFTSVLSLDPKNLICLDRLHVLYGMSKVSTTLPNPLEPEILTRAHDFAAAGVRLGSVITQNKDLKKAIAANIRFHSPSGMSIAIGTAILEDKKFVAEFIALSRKRLSEAYAYTIKTLDEAGIGYHNGGYVLPAPRSCLAFLLASKS